MCLGHFIFVFKSWDDFRFFFEIFDFRSPAWMLGTQPLVKGMEVSALHNTLVASPLFPSKGQGR